MRIFDRTMGLLERTMELRASRHRVISANIANEETPGYRPKEYRFLEALGAATRGQGGAPIRVTHAVHIGPSGDAVGRVLGKTETTATNDMGLDQNSVNLDMELAKLSDNALNFNTAASVISIRFRQLLAAVRDAR
ncbi:MAG: flagellar basal body rod protein FlgB [Nitrospira sp.]|nr:MAG: flagellar basal body rod protein FlgB [Nitrospira sp.]